MWIAFLNQYMTVETAHLWDSEYANATKGSSSNSQYLTLGNISTKFAISSALETIEGNFTCIYIALQGATGNIRSTAIFQQTVLNQLILYATFLQLAQRTSCTGECCHSGSP